MRNGVCDNQTIDGRLPQHLSAFSQKEAMGRGDVNPSGPGIAAGGRGAMQSGPRTDHVVQNDHGLAMNLADQRVARDDAATAALCQESGRWLAAQRLDERATKLLGALRS